MAKASKLNEVQRARESSIIVALAADTIIVIPFILIGVIVGSITIIVETISGLLMFSIEVFALVVMRRIHRGVLVEFEFGVGKIEQVVNPLIAAVMLFGAVWVPMS